MLETEYLKISTELGGMSARASVYGCGRNLVSFSYVRYLRSVTGHLLNRQREREQEETGSDGERRRERPERSVEDSAGERGKSRMDGER